MDSIPAQLGNCVALTMLGVYGNGIARLPPSLKKLRYLKRLMVNNNALVEVPENIMFMHVLEKLHFDHNEVSTFPEALCKVETLKSIFFQKNYLEHLPPDILWLTNVTGETRCSECARRGGGGCHAICIHAKASATLHAQPYKRICKQSITTNTDVTHQHTHNRTHTQNMRKHRIEPL